jgi:hypothetical protein
LTRIKNTEDKSLNTERTEKGFVVCGVSVDANRRKRLEARHQCKIQPTVRD